MSTASPKVFLDTMQQQWFNATETLSFLVIIKKLYLHYGRILTKKEMIETIYTSNQSLWITLAVLRELWYKNVESVISLISRLETFGEQVYTIETPNDTVRMTVEQLLKDDSGRTVFVEKKLQTAWLHIVTPSHRYHRDLDSDLDALLR